MKTFSDLQSLKDELQTNRIEQANAVKQAKEAELVRAQKHAARFEVIKARKDKAIAVLSAQFPQAFDKVNPRPLAVGIHEGLIAQAKAGTLPLSGALVREGLAAWTTRTSYLKTVVVATSRVDLDGNESGVVTPQQEAMAHEDLARRAANRAAKPNKRVPNKRNAKAQPQDATSRAERG